MTGVPASLAADVGGTFTDVVGWDGSRIVSGKVPSTTDDQSAGVVVGAATLDVTADRLLHGTTVATNALLEHRGADTALITTSGFADVIEIGRQDRPSLYDSFADRPEPLVTRHRRYEVSGPADIDDGIGEASAVAISLLYGYRDTTVEQELATVLRERWPHLAVSLSSEVAPEFREFERTSTTLINAYLAPETGRYLKRLLTRSGEAGR